MNKAPSCPNNNTRLENLIELMKIHNKHEKLSIQAMELSLKAQKGVPSKQLVKEAIELHRKTEELTKEMLIECERMKIQCTRK